MRCWGWERTITVFGMAVMAQKPQASYSIGAVGRKQDQRGKVIGTEILLQPRKALSRARALQEIVST